MTEQHQLSHIYLDANATTPVLPRAAKAVLLTMHTLFGNPSSSHSTGLQAKQIMEQTRDKAQKMLGSGQGQVIFTSGATEGIQTAILSSLCAAKDRMVKGRKYTLLYGATEHKAVPESLKHWNQVLDVNAEVKAIPVDKNGILDHDFIAKEVPNALMICTMAVNNETGVYQDLTRLEQTIRSHNSQIFWMVDCVQALGKRSLALSKTTIDYAPFSGHKLYAPKGIGFVYIREGAPFTPFIAGGGQESGLRSGTENLHGLAALDVIFDELMTADSAFVGFEQLESYRTQLANTLKTAFPTLVFNHDFACSVPTTLNFSIPGFSAKEIMDLFDAANLHVSSGSACSSKVTGSFVLDAMQVPLWQSESAIRMSFGPATTQQEIDDACERIQYCAGALGHSCLVHNQLNIDEKHPLDGLVQFKVGGQCTWLFIDKATKSAMIIDPVESLSERLQTMIKCQGLNLVGVFDTHGHADHDSARVAFNLDQITDHLGWPKESSEIFTKNCHANKIEVGQYKLVKVPTPGHTQDSVSYFLFDKADDALQNPLYCFCGDLVLMGTLGRTNFSTSDSRVMYDSLLTLQRLVEPSTLLCPSHDYNNEFVTTLASERLRIPLLEGVLSEQLTHSEFCSEKKRLDAQLDDAQPGELMCGALEKKCDALPLIEYSKDTLSTALQENPEIMLIDIREPHEYALNHADEFDSNVPLTRLVDFIQKHHHCKARSLVLVCRSGSRSFVAAQALRRLGFINVGHLKGGYALSQVNPSA